MTDQSAMSPPPATAPHPPGQDEPRPAESRNFVLLVLYQVILRTGWIFKTESIVMPAVADALSGAGWVRGWLPLLNRLGQSLPPLLAARQIKLLPLKSRAFIVTTASMALTFLGMTAIWLLDFDSSPYAPILFLVLYGLFFAAIGVNALAYNTLQGKLIRTTHRGRLLMIADTLGASSAVLCALWLLPQWLSDDKADFQSIFAFSTALFAAASLMSWFLREEPDHFEEPARPLWRMFEESGLVLRRDANFRLLALVSALFSCALILFPHYQAIGHEKLQLSMRQLVWWVVAQNAGTAIFSLITGPLADFRGNRAVIRFVSCFIVTGPLAALFLLSNAELGARWYWVVFVLVGLTPIAQKSFNNYTLEIAARSDHPRYLSTLNLSMAAPIFLSPLAGWLIDRLGFTPVYLGVAGLLLLGGVLSFGLAEPRHSQPIREPIAELPPTDDSL